MYLKLFTYIKEYGLDLLINRQWLSQYRVLSGKYAFYDS